MSISSLIREKVRELSLEGRDINIRKIARKYKCSPSLVVKNVYKVEREENYKHITKFGVKGKVNLVIIDFDEEKEKDLKQWFASECLPALTQNSPFESSPHLTQNSPFECLPAPECSPHLKQKPNFECLPTCSSESLPALKQNPNLESSPHLMANPNFESSPPLTQKPNFESSPSLTQNPNLKSLPPLIQSSPFECLPLLKQNSPSFSPSPASDPECLPPITKNSPFESSPPLTQNSPFESSPLLKQRSPSFFPAPASECLPVLKKGSPSFSPSPTSTSAPECLPPLTPNSPFESSPRLTQNNHLESSPFLNPNPNLESSPHLTPNPNLECLPSLTQNTNFKSSPLLMANPNFESLPALTQKSPFECLPYLKQNSHSESSPHLTQNSNLQAPLFNVHHNLKEKEKVSYNLLKEKETEKFINKFLSISQIDSLTSLNKYEKEILKTYIKYGGKLRESEIKFGKEILFYATPKQFEAILLKVIREKKGETPRISYLCEVTKRFNLKSRKKKATPKLFEKAKAFNKFKTYENSIDKGLSSTFSYLGLTGEDALKAFFGDSFKKENFVGVLNG